MSLRPVYVKGAELAVIFVDEVVHRFRARMAGAVMGQVDLPFYLLLLRKMQTCRNGFLGDAQIAGGFHTQA